MGKDLSTLVGNGNISQVHLDKKKGKKAFYYTSRGKLAMVDIKSGKSTNFTPFG